jgi:YD repeat-containing protein
MPRTPLVPPSAAGRARATTRAIEPTRPDYPRHHATDAAAAPGQSALPLAAPTSPAGPSRFPSAAPTSPAGPHTTAPPVPVPPVSAPHAEVPPAAVPPRTVPHAATPRPAQAPSAWIDPPSKHGLAADDDEERPVVIEGAIVEAAGRGPSGADQTPDTGTPAASGAPRPPSAASAADAARPVTAASAAGRPAAEQSADKPARTAEPPLLPDGFVAVNSVEENLLEAAHQHRTDRFLSTLLLAKVLVPGWDDNDVPDPQRWSIDDIGDKKHLVVYTSQERMVGHLGPSCSGGWARFTTLISMWPGEHLSFAVNPDTPVGATLPGNEVVALASWAAKMGLTDDLDPDAEPARTGGGGGGDDQPVVEEPLVMQKSISAEQVALYLERGYDRASGFVHRANEVDHLCTPGQIYRTLGLSYSGSTFRPDAAEIYLLRWRAYRGDLYRISYGGQDETSMRAMRGWVIERPPFRGNGFAPCDTGDVITEFKVDSVRLPHGAQLWRLDRDGNERLIALLDADGPRWRQVGA